MFDGLWPGFDEAEVPITSITNGVHAPTWVAREIFDLAAQRSGADPDADDADGLVWDVVDKVAGERHLGDQAACCASGWSTTPARGCASPGSKRGARRGRARLDRRARSTPTC